ncbi:MAG: DUF2065 domain-containing protein [Sphingomonadales bacterium]
MGELTWSDLGVALGLVLVIEGALYALFPDLMRTVMRQALELDKGTLRWAAAAFVLAGLLLVRLIRG